MRINTATILIYLLTMVVVIFRVSRLCTALPLNSSTNSASETTTKTDQSIESNSIQRVLVEPQQTKSRDSNRSLKRVFLSNRTITCNDGSQAGFYLRKAPNSKKWVVFLEGGWHCYDLKSCRARWLKLRHLMTSAQWPETRDVGGILSPLEENNPFWYGVNHVLVPYCSSDSWSGSKTQINSRDGWKFMGSLIIRQVISDLIPLGLGRPSGSELLLVGSSAGGLGVMLNLDQISNFLQNEKKLKVLVRGVSDSGWFLDREPYTPGAVAASEAVRQGWKMWEGVLPETCLLQHSNEPWRCYFAHRLYPTLKSPLFVFQWLFDEAQMRADSVGAPVTPQQWNYIHEMGGALRTSLDNVTAVFAPSCIGHAVLSKKDWLNVKIDDISLAEALHCWEKATGRKQRNYWRSTKNRKGNNNKNNRHHQKNKHTNTKKNERQQEERVIKERKNQHHRHNNERKRNHHRRRTTENPKEENTFGVPENKTHHNERQRHGRRKHFNDGGEINRNVTNNYNNNKRRRKQNQQEEHQQDKSTQLHRRSRKNDLEMNRNSLELKRCSLRLLERCSWPQCNHSCPTLTNPLTGEEMRFLELLASFGLDIEAVAAALGVDMLTLNNMDQAELVNLLTQQAN